MKQENMFERGLFESAVWQAMTSIQRVLQKGAKEEFKKIMFTYLKKLKKIRNRDQFDKFHCGLVKKIHNNIKQNEKNKKEQCSYGHAQKLVNVFLKYYIYWYKQNERQYDKLREWLHCPLDSRVMNNVYNEYRTICDNSGVKPITLSKMKDESDYKTYYKKWQEVIAEINRKQYPQNYIIELDIIFWPDNNEKEK